MQTYRHTSLFLFTLFALAAVPAVASAQELTGTYIGYADTSTTGSLVRGTHSVAYGESSGVGACDIFAQGTFLEGYALEASGSFGDALSATVTTDTGSPTGTALVSGRNITWSGTVASGSASLRLDQTLSFMTSDRAISIAVTLTNNGSETLNDIYYMRGGDPDQAYCSTAVYDSTNDVVRQPPTDTSALVTGSAGGVVVGLGSFDSRARADVSSFDLTGPGARWLSPVDPGGTTADIVIALVFHVTSLAPGASTTLQMFYVFASTAATLTTRFDALRTATPSCSEGASCTSGSLSGVCHASACCTGCWDGFACQTGTAASSCGRGGTSCSSCNDGYSCTTDSCTTGACTNVVASGCMIDGACEGSGENSPFDACLYCNPSSSTTSWSARVPCGTDVDMGIPGEDAGIGVDMGIPGEDAGMGVDSGMSSGDGGMSGDGSASADGGFVGMSPGGSRRRGGCDVGSVGASEGGGILAIAMLLVVTLVRRRREHGAGLDA